LGQGHNVAFSFQVAPGLRVEEFEEGCSIVGPGEEPILHLFHSLLDAEGRPVRQRLEPGLVSQVYAHRATAPRWVCEMEGGEIDFLTIMLPGPAKRPVLETRMLPSGLLIQFEHEARAHVLGWGSGRPVQWAEGETDARFFWHQRNLEREEEEGLMAVGVSHLRIGDRDIVHSTEPLGEGEWRLHKGVWEALMESFA
jgi:hypothetical protein